MTATQSAPLALASQLVFLLKRTSLWGLHALIALAIVMLAGFVAIATAATGLALAAFAILMRVLGRSQWARKVSEPHTAQNSTITLDARKTPRGWTVE